MSEGKKLMEAEVELIQREIINKNPKGLVSAIIVSAGTVDDPKFPIQRAMLAGMLALAECRYPSFSHYIDVSCEDWSTCPDVDIYYQVNKDTNNRFLCSTINTGCNHVADQVLTRRYGTVLQRIKHYKNIDRVIDALVVGTYHNSDADFYIDDDQLVLG